VEALRHQPEEPEHVVQTPQLIRHRTYLKEAD
jgi:hypothetical protein